MQDFRSWQQVDVDLSPGCTVFQGANGNGKTNLVEAVGYLATLGSHRVPGDAALIRLGATQARLGATVINAGRELRIDVEVNQSGANRARINRSPARRARDVLGILRVVLFAPEDLALVRGDPAGRRRFLDQLGTTRLPRLAGVSSDYDRVLRQRAALLKSAGRRVGSAETSTLDTWDSQLARHGAELVAHRLRLVHELNPLVAQSYATISSAGSPAGIAYHSSYLPPEFLDPQRSPGVDDGVALTEIMMRALAQARASELERGVCLVGPHRDDLGVMLGPAPAKGYASHGESWSLALALRLGALELVRALGSDPVLILDDVFAELDEPRRAAVAAVAAETEQVLVTAAVPGDVPVDLAATELRVDLTGAPQCPTSRLIADSVPAHGAAQRHGAVMDSSAAVDPAEGSVS